MSCSGNPSLGSVFESLETRTLLSGQQILFDAANPATFFDADGDLVTVTVTGAGHGVVYRSAAGTVDADQIEVLGVTSTDTVKIQVKGRGTTTLGDIEVNGSVKQLLAPAVKLTGDLTVSGEMKKLVLGDVDGGVTQTISIHTDPSIAVHPKTTLSVTLGSVVDTNFISNLIPIKQFKAVEWLNVNADREVLDAPSIGNMRITGSKTAAGNFEADLTTGDGKVIRVVGSVIGSQWQFAGNLASLTVGKWIDGSTVKVAGDINKIKAGAVSGSDFFAGVDSAARHAQSLAEFTHNCTIKSFVVSGWRLPKGDTTRFFVDSNVSATNIIKAAVKNILFDGSVSAYGFFSKGTAGTIKSVRHTDTADRTMNFSYSAKNQTLSNPPAFVIQPITNTAPLADAGLNLVVPEQTLVTLSGSGSDAEGPVTFKWTQISGPAVTINNSAQAVANFMAPEVSVTTLLRFQLAVRDQAGAVTTDTVTITVNRANDLPVVDEASARVQQWPGVDFAAINQDPINGDGVVTACNAYEGRTVVLSGLGSDIDGPVTYSWSQISGTAVALTGAATAEASFVVPTLAAGATQADATLVFRLTVTDNEGGTATQDVTVRARLLGDLDWDDVVEGLPGMDDFLAAFTAGGSDNLERYDIDNSGIVDFDDIDVVAANDGRQIL